MMGPMKHFCFWVNHIRPLKWKTRHGKHLKHSSKSIPRAGLLKKPGKASRVSSTVDHHYYPAFIDLKGKQCIVVGGGKVAERKVAALLRSGAKVTVISPSVTG